MTHYQYAAYGSNLHPVRLQKRVPSARLLGTAVLPGYELRFNKLSHKDNSGKCNIVRGGNGVFLAIFTIAESERTVLDECEGLGAGYEYFAIETEEFGFCSSYIAAPSAIVASLKPLCWYKEMVLHGCSYHRFPAEYLRNVERVAAIEDPDVARSRQGWRIVEELRDCTKDNDSSFVVQAR